MADPRLRRHAGRWIFRRWNRLARLVTLSQAPSKMSETTRFSSKHLDGIGNVGWRRVGRGAQRQGPVLREGGTPLVNGWIAHALLAAKMGKQRSTWRSNQ